MRGDRDQRSKERAHGHAGAGLRYERGLVAGSERMAVRGVCRNAGACVFGDARWFMESGQQHPLLRVRANLFSNSWLGERSSRVLISTPNVAWSQNGTSPVQASAAPVQKSKYVSPDDRSYLPPSMRGETNTANASAPVASQTTAAPAKATRTAHRHVRRERRYAEASGWGFFGD